MFEFTQDCVIGVEQIDDEHRYLFELLHKGMYMLESAYCTDHYSDIKELLAELDEYAEQHFTHEEAYMEQIRDPELILQRPQHMAFRDKILEFNMKNIDEADEQQEALTELILFLARWLYQHIIGSDCMIGKLPPLEEWMLRDNPCEFVEEYKTGIDMIDREHKILFEIVERANKAVRSFTSGDDFDEISGILKELKQYTLYHFTDEEEYMQNIGYEGYESQKRAHEAFIARIDEIDMQKIEGDPKTYLNSLLAFLLGWLVHHILQSDKKIPYK